MKRILVLAVTFALAGCGPTTPKTDPAADKEAINKVRDDFTSAFNANDATKVGAIYSEKGRVHNPNQPTIEGRAAIVEQNKMLFDLFKAKIRLSPHSTVVSGDLAFDEGTYTMDMTPKAAGSKPNAEEGRYIVVLQRETDGWKVIEDIGNSSKPAVPAPPTPAKAKVQPKAPAKAQTKAPAKGK